MNAREKLVAALLEAMHFAEKSAVNDAQRQQKAESLADRFLPEFRHMTPVITKAHQIRADIMISDRDLDFMSAYLKAMTMLAHSFAELCEEHDIRWQEKV